MNVRLQKLIQKYNQERNLIVISSYPEKGVKYSGKVCAVGGFAKNTVESLSRRVVVFTVKTKPETEIYEEDNVLVVRCLERNKTGSYVDLLKDLRFFDQIKDVLIEFEFASYGDTLMAAFFPIVLAAMKLMGKRVNLVLHQILVELSDLHGHLGMSRGGIKLRLLNAFLRLYYPVLCMFADKVVVLEEEFKRRLARLISVSKIVVIPHGVDTTLRFVSMKVARRRLGLPKRRKIALFLGYLTWYKGADWLLNNWNMPGFKLIMAGGPSFTQINKSHYRNYVEKLTQRANKKGIQITGFLNEKDMALYVAACDVIVLPYRVFMSSSGPLSWAIAAKKPFLISTTMARILETADFKRVFEKLGFEANEVVFELRKKSLVARLKKADWSKLKRLAGAIRWERGFGRLSKFYEELLCGEVDLERGLGVGQLTFIKMWGRE